MLDSTPTTAVLAASRPEHQRSRRPQRFLATIAALAIAVVALAAPAHAQSAFVGGGVAFEDIVIPSLSVQAGGIVAPNVELRGTLDAFAFLVDFLDLGGDVLYSESLSSGTRWYAGGGPDLYYVSLGSASQAVTGGLHLTGGVELPIGRTTGIYLELKPGVPFSFAGVLVATRFGVDVHF